MSPARPQGHVDHRPRTSSNLRILQVRVLEAGAERASWTRPRGRGEGGGTRVPRGGRRIAWDQDTMVPRLQCFVLRS